MANRVIFGNRSGEYGLFVSRPGFDVTTANIDQLLMSTAAKNLQVIQRGEFTGTNGGTTTISWSALGFRPVIILSSQMVTRMTYTSDNGASVITTDPPTVWNLSNNPGIIRTVYWSVVSEVY